MNLCVNMIIRASFQPFLHNLSLMNLDMVILEYRNDGLPRWSSWET